MELESVKHKKIKFDVQIDEFYDDERNLILEKFENSDKIKDLKLIFKVRDFYIKEDGVSFNFEIDNEDFICRYSLFGKEYSILGKEQFYKNVNNATMEIVNKKTYDFINRHIEQIADNFKVDVLLFISLRKYRKAFNSIINNKNVFISDKDLSKGYILYHCVLLADSQEMAEQLIKSKYYESSMESLAIKFSNLSKECKNIIKNKGVSEGFNEVIDLAEDVDYAIENNFVEKINMLFNALIKNPNKNANFLLMKLILTGNINYDNWSSIFKNIYESSDILSIQDILYKAKASGLKKQLIFYLDVLEKSDNLDNIIFAYFTARDNLFVKATLGYKKFEHMILSKDNCPEDVLLAETAERVNSNNYDFSYFSNKKMSQKIQDFVVSYLFLEKNADNLKSFLKVDSLSELTLFNVYEFVDNQKIKDRNIIKDIYYHKNTSEQLKIMIDDFLFLDKYETIRQNLNDLNKLDYNNLLKKISSLHSFELEQLLNDKEIIKNKLKLNEEQSNLLDIELLLRDSISSHYKINFLKNEDIDKKFKDIFVEKLLAKNNIDLSKIKNDKFSLLVDGDSYSNKIKDSKILTYIFENYLK